MWTDCVALRVHLSWSERNTVSGKIDPGELVGVVGGCSAIGVFSGR
jgi:hypothetical protein